MIIIFDKNNELHGFFSTIPSEEYLASADWTVKEIPEDMEIEYDKKYVLVDDEIVNTGEPLLSDEEIAFMEAEEQATQYQRDRQYPSIEDQLDDLYHNGIEGWKATIKAVKDAHPKPTGE